MTAKQHYEPFKNSAFNEYRTQEANDNKNQKVNKNRAKEANDENRHNTLNDKIPPVKYNQILKEINSGDKNELQCPLPTQDNPHFIHDLCAENS